MRNNYGTMPNAEVQKLLVEHHSTKEITRKALSLGLEGRVRWSQEEADILQNTYELLPFSEVQQCLPNKSPSAILGKARSMGLLSYFYLNRTYSPDELQFLTDNYLTLSNADIAKHLGRTKSSIEQKLRVMGLLRPKEESSYIKLTDYVRSRLQPWKREVKAANHYTCALTGSTDNIIIHHIRGFNLIFEETIETLNFPEYDDFKDYTDEQLALFTQTFLDIQEYYGSYVCITESVHVLFHRNYGYGDNTQEQWDDFVEKFKNHYFDNVA